MSQPQRILVMGLPGAGKTYFAQRLKNYLESQHVTVSWINADTVRKQYNDWDFSVEGRVRQSRRMLELAEQAGTHYVICDFIAPLSEMRKNFAADYTIWMDTISLGRFDDTNQMFTPPLYYDFRITEKNAENWVEIVGRYILAKNAGGGIHNK